MKRCLISFLAPALLLFSTAPPAITQEQPQELAEPAEATPAEPEAQAEATIRWTTDLDDALDQAEDEARPILLYFSASWCQPCQLLKSTTLRDRAVITMLEPYVKVQIDYDSDPYLVAKYGITGVPAVLLLDPSGERVATSVGYRETEPFQDWLARHAEEVSPEAAQLAERTRNDFLRSITDQLASDNLENQSAALNKLFDECVAKNVVAMTFARSTLPDLATDKPALLEPFLKDPRLLVRILVGNAMTNANPALDYDPWSPPTTGGGDEPLPAGSEQPEPGTAGVPAPTAEEA